MTNTKESWQVIPITKQMGQTANVIVKTDGPNQAAQNVNQIQENQKYDTVNQMNVKPLGGGGKKNVLEYMLFYKDKSWLYQMDGKMKEKDAEESIVEDFMNKKNMKTEYLLKIRNLKKQKDTLYVVRQTQRNRIRKLYD